MQGVRRSYSLNEGWTIEKDACNIGLSQSWFIKKYGEGEQDAIVPGIIQQVYPGYHGVVWYRTRFNPMLASSGLEYCCLNFGRVDYYADIWLNGVYCGSHEGGEDPFEVNVTSMLKYDCENLLVVRVINPTNEAIDGIALNETPHANRVIPYGVGCSYNCGGIMQPVELHVKPAIYVSDVFITPVMETGKVNAEITLKSNIEGEFNCKLEMDIRPNGYNANNIEASLSEAIKINTSKQKIVRIIQVDNWKLWEPDYPNLYRLNIGIEVILSNGVVINDTYSERFGFRKFNVGGDGYFYLNGKRIFLRSAHTGNHYPIGQAMAHKSELFRRDLLYAKAAGLNMVRFIAGMACPEQLSYCDELGLMVYEESYAAWMLEDSPYLPERFDRSTKGMVLRDRNHPCIVIWGLLNETKDNAASRHAVESLPFVRSLDNTRLILLSSGRWDGHMSTGSVCNPGNCRWEHVWGTEAQDALDETFYERKSYPGGYINNAGDAHFYPRLPEDTDTNNFLRMMGKDTKPVFLSEYGIGSAVDAIHVTALFEQEGSRADLEDFTLYRQMADRYKEDWEWFGMNGVYSFPEDMLKDSQKMNGKLRLQGIDAIRSNPKICGYSLTGLVDQGMSGEGLWSTWRELKPGIIDAMVEGMSPLHWCLFIEPIHAYSGRPIKIEAVIANENVLKPGAYPLNFRISGPQGIVWEKEVEFILPECIDGNSTSFAFSVLEEEITLEVPSGEYCFAASMKKGGAPSGGRKIFHITNQGNLPTINRKISFIGIDSNIISWLTSKGIECRNYTGDSLKKNEIVLVGSLDKFESEHQIDTLIKQISDGAVAIFISLEKFSEESKNIINSLLGTPGKCAAYRNWLYHFEFVGKKHPIFYGLKSGGILDWDYYGQIIPDLVLNIKDKPFDVAAAAFAVGYICEGGYASGLISGAYSYGKGKFILNTLQVIENFNLNPAADQLLLNMIDYAAGLSS